MAERQPDHIRFSELLPFYVNGTLGSDDKQFIETYLAQHPETQAELEFTKRMHAAEQRMAGERAADAGLQQLLQVWHAQTRRPNWRERLRLTCRSWGLTPAFALAASVAVVQGAVLLLYLQPATEPERLEQGRFRGVEMMPATRADLMISVDPAVDFGSIVVLLRENNCRIVAGPSATGDLWLAVEQPPTVEQIRLQLLASGLILDAVSAGTPTNN